MADFFNFWAILILYFVIGFSLIGATLLCKGFEYAKVPGFPFIRCWKIYLAGLLYGYLVIWGVGLILSRPAQGEGAPDSSIEPIVRTVLFFGIPMIAIPLLGRDFSRRAIAVELIAILLANSIMIFVAYTTLPHLLGTQTQTNPIVPAESTGPRPMPKQR